MQPLVSHIIVTKVGLFKDLQTQKAHHPRFRCSRTPFSIVRGRVHNAIFIAFFCTSSVLFLLFLGFFLFTTFFTTFVTNYFLFVISAGRGGRRFGHQNRGDMFISNHRFLLVKLSIFLPFSLRRCLVIVAALLHSVKVFVTVTNFVLLKKILPPPTHNNRKGGKQFKTGRSCRLLLT